MNNKEMVVKTQVGEIKVIQGGDTEYPSAVISINGKELVVVEYNNVDENHAIMVWNSDTNESDDYEYIQKF